ncbi:flavoprotein WrbA [Leptolyngbya sp. NIES-2104]|nr:flavodoxin domain-containing protein [Leptolyngbya sp. NIES-2104]GAP98015.1 flavoprotein WrbA [Leptolyngbya sp. NIES-2104]
MADTYILIVFHSLQGHTQRVAEIVAEGARSIQSTKVVMKSVDEVDRTDFKDCDALIMGSPVHQRSMSWEMKRFVDLVCEPSWFFDDMVGRVGGVFTTGGGHGDCGAGCELAQLSMLGNLASLGMVLVTLPKTTPGFNAAGMHWGAHVRTGGRQMEPATPQQLDPEALEAAFHHGANIARVAVNLRNVQLMAQGNVVPAQPEREQRTQMQGIIPQGVPR